MTSQIENDFFLHRGGIFFCVFLWIFDVFTRACTRTRITHTHARTRMTHTRTHTRITRTHTHVLAIPLGKK